MLGTDGQTPLESLQRAAHRFFGKKPVPDSLPDSCGNPSIQHGHQPAVSAPVNDRELDGIGTYVNGRKARGAYA